MPICSFRLRDLTSLRQKKLTVALFDLSSLGQKPSAINMAILSDHKHYIRSMPSSLYLD